MKKLLLITLFWANYTLSPAQSVPSTGSVANWCFNCLPTGWMAVTNSPSVSSTTWNGNKSLPWDNALPNPPSAGSHGAAKTFISGYHKDAAHDVATANISGLTVGQTYDFEYNVISGSTAITSYGSSAIISLNNNGTVITQTTDFGAIGANAYNTWVNKHIEFKANSPSVAITFTGSGAGSTGGIVGLDVQGVQHVCNAGSAPVSLTATSITNTCPSTTVDLATTVGGVLPQGASVVWFENPNHAAPAVADPTAVGKAGKYYAFFYDEPHNCYNTANSTSSVLVNKTFCCPAGDKQVVVSSSAASNTCPTTTVNLNALITSTKPSDTEYRWFTNANHSGSFVADPTKVAVSGNYYAFIYSAASDCYNTLTSTALVQVNIGTCCAAGVKQVLVSSTSISNACPSATVNLNALITSAKPAGTEYRWFSNANRSGAFVADPTQVGAANTYYAFIYDNTNSCYNVTTSTAMVQVSIAACCTLGNEKITLSGNSIANVCPMAAVDLNTLITSAKPAGTVYRWFTNPNHTGSPVDPSSVAVSDTYYPFIYDAATNCYNTDNSMTPVVASITACPCNAGTNQLTFKNNAISATNVCPKSYVDLNELLNEQAPAGTEIVWFLNDAHAGDPVARPDFIQVSTATYFYAFIYDKINGCYNTDHSTAKIYVHKTICQVNCNAGTDQVTLSANTVASVCPELIVNLNNLTVGTPPGNCGYVWYTNPQHTGPRLTSTDRVGPGTYYAFIWDTQWGCFNTDNSLAQVTVTVNPQCVGVQTSIKTRLQGAMQASGVTMKNALQTFGGAGLLPVTDPYGSGRTDPDINNVNAIAGTLADWIKVEIRDAAAPATILETQSLLLKTNGDIVDVNGAIPVFKAQNAAVRIVLKHRNHIAVMSNPVDNFNSEAVQYDFTTALTQAYNDGSATPQMKIVNGVWCMINGDVDQNLAVINQDVNQTRNAHKQGLTGIYSPRDVNMNGAVENGDINILRNRFGGGSFSILVKFK